MSDRLTESLTLPAAGRWETDPMTTTTQQRTTPRWALSFLAAIVAVLAVVFAAATASAATAAGSETRVRASGFVVEVPVGPPEHISAGQRLGEAADRVVTVVATGVAANAGERSVAIGEDMTNRVEPFAKRIGADTYKADPSAPRETWMENNRAWIRKQMEDGCTVYDCGPAPGRANFPGPTSPYYKMELEELRNYPNYIRVWLDE